MRTTLDTCMVLAAGLGNRMRPLTNDRPKPLLDVAGKSLLDHALDMAAEAGLDRAVVNVHYFPDMVEAHVAARAGDPAIQISNERAQLLETGGGVLKALPLLDRETVVIFNADNVWVDGPMQTATALLAAWQPEKMDTLLLLAPVATATGYNGPGDFNLAADGQLIRRGEAATAEYAYAGIHILKTKLFAGMKVEPFSLNRVWNIAAAENRLFGTVHPGAWYHVGTPEGIMMANDALNARA